MGRYRRTVYCRHCYAEGHTKRGCPKVKEIVKANPNSYLADSLKRRCSWCHNEGHTKPKCPQFVEHIRLKRVETLERRAEICDELTKQGIAPGALLSAEFYDRSSPRGWKTGISIVEKIDWEIVHKKTNKFIKLSCLSFEAEEYVSLPNPDYAYVKVIAPMSTEFARSFNTKQMEKTNDKVCKEVR